MPSTSRGVATFWWLAAECCGPPPGNPSTHFVLKMIVRKWVFRHQTNHFNDYCCGKVGKLGQEMPTPIKEKEKNNNPAFKFCKVSITEKSDVVVVVVCQQ